VEGGRHPCPGADSELPGQGAELVATSTCHNGIGQQKSPISSPLPPPPTSAMATSDLTLLETFLQDWRELLSLWAQNGTLMRAAQYALQLEGEPEKLRELVREWSQGGFRNLPPVVLLPASAMPGAVGAYAISTGTIYLNQDWLASANKDRVIGVLTEELGHHLDRILNSKDTPGDEGALFSVLSNGQGLGEAALLAAKNQDDRSIVFLGDQVIQVENASATAVEQIRWDITLVNASALLSNMHASLASQWAPWVRAQKIHLQAWQRMDSETLIDQAIPCLQHKLTRLFIQGLKCLR
jgi:hypothetical protein